MKYIVRLLLLMTLFTAFRCPRKDEPKECMPYSEGVEKGIVPDKTTAIRLNNGSVIALDYVRDPEGAYSCYGHLELDRSTFETVFRQFDKDYDIKNIHSIVLYSEKDDLCDDNTLKQQNVKAYAVRYLDKDRKVMLDFKNLTTGELERYHVSNYYASVLNYFLRKHTQIIDSPAITAIVNIDLDKSAAKFLPKTEDKLYQLANSN